MASASKTKTLYASNGATGGNYTLEAFFSEGSVGIDDQGRPYSEVVVTASITSHNIRYSGANQNTWDVYWIDNNQNTTPLHVKSESITSLGRNTTKSMTENIVVYHNSDGNLTGKVQVNYNNHGTGYAPSSNNVSTDDTALTYVPMYANVTSFNVNKRDETSVAVDFSVDATIDYCQYRIGTPNTPYWGNWTDTGVSAESRQFIINNLSVNTSYQFQIRVKRADSQQWKESNVVIQTTYDYPQVTSASNFNIGSNPTIYVYNPLNRYITLDFIKAANDATYFSFIGNISGYYTPEMNDSTGQETLYGTLTPPTNEATYKLKVTYGSSVKTYNNNNKYVAATDQCKPIVSASIEDVNQTTLLLTNDNTKIIKGFSTARITPIVAKISSAYDLNASISKYVINGEDVTSNYKDIENAELLQYSVVAINNRNYESDTIYSSGATFHPYINPTIDGLFERPSQTGNEIEVNFNGIYYNDYFDLSTEEIHNNLTIKWYVRLNEEDQWTLGGTLVENTDYTITDNIFESNGDVSLTCPPTITSGEWDYMTKYYFKLEAIDRLQSVLFEQYVKIGQPYFSWWHDDLTDKNIFNVNGDYYQNNQPFSGGGGGVSGDTFPIGGILPYPSSTAPTNWLICDGSAVSRSDYSELFAVIGTTYGSGDGSTTFNLPNLKGRVVVGKDSSQTEFDTLGETGGEKTHTLVTSEMPKHNHHMTGLNGTGSGEERYPFIIGGGSPNWDTWNDGALVGGDQPHNNLQPYIVTNYIIKAKQSAGVVADVANNKTDSNTDVYSCNYVNNLINVIYPVGSIYISVNSTNPSNLFGGTWVAWGTGRVPVGVDTSQTEFNIVEKTGGSKYIQNHTHTCDPGYGNMYFASGSESRWLPLYGTDQYNMHTKGVDSNVTTGDSGNLQPYITCYMWKRTA